MPNRPTDLLHTILRDSVRSYLSQAWAPEGDAGRAADSAELVRVWNGLIDLGLWVLGTDTEYGGVREITVVMEELGRASCPAPMLPCVLVNRAFRNTNAPVAMALLAKIHAGEARAAFSFGACDPDLCAGNIFIQDGVATGKLRFVEANEATHLIVISGISDIAIVDLKTSGATITPTRALGASGLSEIDLRQTPCDRLPLAPGSVDDLLIVAKLALGARAYGAARRSFDLAVSYAGERRQFGEPIGKFQAIQHKLANCLISLEGARLTINNAARLCDEDDANWRYFALSAAAFGGDSLRQVSLETHHTFGAIGYAEEHEAPRHFKRVHLDTIALGGAVDARRRIAALLLDGDGARLPECDLGESGNALRDEVCAWLEINWSGERKAAFDAQPFSKREFDAEFARALGATGWIGLGWPREFGGQARGPQEQIAFIEAMERFEAPRIGAAIQANAIIMFGTAEQKEKYLPEILAGEAMYGMGYSEPNAGSDLSAIRTTAVRDGDDWVINGQKIWTTTWWGKYMYLAAKTDPAAKPPHAGLSMFIVPMTTPGITVRPAATMYDGTFANIYYDDVRIPAENIVGEENGGWRVLTGALAFERGLVGGGIVLKVAHAFERLRQRVRTPRESGAPLAQDPIVRDRLARLAAEIEVGRRLMMECAELAADGVTPPDYGAISKVFSGELMERFGEAALDILGLCGVLSEQTPGAIDNGRFEQNLRHSLMWVISIGTNEIQRNLIAQKGLALPR
ncbi:MAG: acyl-CoA dehydrogenase [Hyphomicrobiales bacterium]|nr:acyl-CoA dehydrogenase [Hyphomicrobiales bacterium]